MANDYISRADVINLIEKSMNDLEYDSENKEFQDAVMALPAADVVERNADPVADEWIPVSERSPTESGTYICTCYDGTINRVTFIKYQKTYARWDLSGARSYWRVKAWIPLPIPYKDEKEI